jgi:hypothetical protein
MKLIKWALAALVLFALVRVFVISSENTTPRPSQVPAAENIGTLKLPSDHVKAGGTQKSKNSQPEDKRFEQCRAKLKKAQKLEVLYDLKIDPLPRVVIGPTFYSIPLDAKQGFADTVNCFLMTGKDEYINFDLLDYRTGHIVAQYSAGQLRVE